MQLKFHMVTIEDLVPEKHFLRKLERVLDLSFVYEETQHLYSRKYGRPPIDPVVLVKYLLVGFLYGIPRSGKLSSEFRPTWRCGGIWDWTCLTGCRTTVRSVSCGVESQRSARYFAGYLRR